MPSDPTHPFPWQPRRRLQAATTRFPAGHLSPHRGGGRSFSSSACMHVYMCICTHMCIYIYICIYRLVPGPGTTYDGVGGWGGMLTFMWTCRSSWCYAHAGWGGGGMGWDVNVHVNLQKQLIVRTRGVGWDVNVHVNLQMMMILMLMMMMMTTLMKLVNSATKFRHGIDKFYQPNSGLRSSRTWDEAIHIYIYAYIYILVIVDYNSMQWLSCLVRFW